MLALALSSLAFKPGLTPPHASGADVSRRQAMTNLAGFAAAAVAAPAFADGANNPTNAFKARSIYGSRIFNLKGASPEAVAADKNAFTLFISGTYRNVWEKDTKKQLTGISKSLLAAAQKGDASKTQELLGQFLKVAEIDRDYAKVPGGNFDPKQRRNAGAPGTAEIEAQMGTLSYSLYKPTK
ncbi:MAG: hypothetical protein SGPRY_007793 [Prymnesium sp.]